MDAINSLLDMNIIKWLYGLIIILCGANFIISSVAKFCEWIGKPLSWFNKTAKDHEMLIELKAKHEKDYDTAIKHDKEIKSDIAELKEMFLEKQNEDIRWEILDFCSALAGGRKYNREAFDHIFRTYRKYEEILEKNGMENGLISESMKVCEEIYHDRLKAGEII